MPQNPIRVSVVMAAWNAAATIEETIRSVQAQTVKDLELLVMDDCSADNTAEVVRRLAAEDDRINCIRLPENGGAAAARNAGIRQAKGRCIALVDSDDLWAPEKLERQLALMDETGADLIYTSYDFIGPDGAPVGRPYTVPPRTDFAAMLKENVIGCSTVLVKAEILQAHPFSTEFYHEDYALWMALLREGVTAAGDPAVLMRYRKAPGSRSSNKLKAALRRWTIYRKALGLGLFDSARAFAAYAVHGVMKHF